MYIEDQAEPFPRIIIKSDKLKNTMLAVYKSVSNTCPSPPADRSMHIANWSKEVTMESYNPCTYATSHSKVVLLNSSLHDTDDSAKGFLLPNRHLNLKGNWKVPSSKFGEVSYYAGYWEWTEDILAHHENRLQKAEIYAAVHASLFTYVCDRNVLQSFFEFWCPSTNTLHTSAGEFSISLWDLCGFSRLPIHGDFYDEVVPTAKELLGDDACGPSLPRSSSTRPRNDSTLPRSCKYLFFAYHLLPKDSDGISISDWISLWYKGPLRYKEPPARSNRKRLNRPKLTRNPCGNIDASLLPQVKGRNEPFTLLKVEDDVREETYVAAFLSCWLCSFVLPHHKVGRIRATVFKVATRMAHGNCLSLAIPVLASIYRGLRNISTSPDLTESAAVFPIHFIYGWLSRYCNAYFPSKVKEVLKPKMKYAQMVTCAGENMARYFDLPEARKLIPDIDPSDLRNLHPHHRDVEVVLDCSSCSNTYKGVFISLQSSYLTFRCGSERKIEAYSPHRFSRQHGFCQHVPGCLKKEILHCDLQELVELWRSCTFLDPSAKIILPGHTPSLPLITQEYAFWWTNTWDATNHSRVVLKLKNAEPVTRAPDQYVQQGNDSNLLANNPSPPQRASSIPSKENQKVTVSQHPNRLDKEKGKVLEIDGVVKTKKRLSLLEASVPRKINSLDGDEVILALSCSDEYQLKKKQKLTELDEKVKITSECSAASVNEHDPFDLLFKNDVQIIYDGENSGEHPAVRLPILEEKKLGEKDVSDEPKKDLPGLSLPRSTPAVSTFCPRAIHSEAQQVLANFYWSKICQKIRKTPFEQLSEIESDVQGVLSQVNTCMNDSSVLENRLKQYFAYAAKYTKVKLDSRHKKSQDEYEQSLLLIQQNFDETEVRKHKHSDDVECLRRRLDELSEQVKTTSLLLQQAEGDLSTAEKDVKVHREALLKLQNSSYMSEDESVALGKLEALLEESRQDLITLNLFP